MQPIMLLQHVTKSSLSKGTSAEGLPLIHEASTPQPHQHRHQHVQSEVPYSHQLLGWPSLRLGWRWLVCCSTSSQRLWQRHCGQIPQGILAYLFSRFDCLVCSQHLGQLSHTHLHIFEVLDVGTTTGPHPIPAPDACSSCLQGRRPHGRWCLGLAFPRLQRPKWGQAFGQPTACCVTIAQHL